MDEDNDAPSQDVLELQRTKNIQALVDGSLEVAHRSYVPKLLPAPDLSISLRKPFKSPHPSAPDQSGSLKRALLARKQFVPWGGGSPLTAFPRPTRICSSGDSDEGGTPPTPPDVSKTELPPGVEPLFLWQPGEGESGPAVEVDPMLTRWLRPHQREGVAFMFECVAGLREYQGRGCILADDMGLGKTLQGIALLHTLLSTTSPTLLGLGDGWQGGEGEEGVEGGETGEGGKGVGQTLIPPSPPPTALARRVIIACPTSLVSNWESECEKWLCGRLRVLALAEASREDVECGVDRFLSPANPLQVLIISYETFRLHAARFAARPWACDLLLCDEAHRLKNDATLTSRALGSLRCARRVLLSGTPLQNKLDEFYAMVSFCNPGLLGSPAAFRRRFEAPILAGREPGAAEQDSELGAGRTEELSRLVQAFILRRTNALLSAHLPPKLISIVCCRPTPLQQRLYAHFLGSRATARLLSEGPAAKAQVSAKVLSAITSLRKLLGHPKLVYDELCSPCADKGRQGGFSDAAEFFEPGVLDDGRRGRGGMAIGWERLSGKLALLADMLRVLYDQTHDRIVVVSNYTQTLDLIAQHCRENGYPHVRLDGSTSITKRQKLVKTFGDPNESQFVFLLSSKAGGCGLNLVGGNRLVLFDPSWNPADDKQAAGRVWRDGQTKHVFVYRFLTTGTIEEKVYQRQLSKEGLQQVVDTREGASRGGSNLMSVDELRDLFTYDSRSPSNTYQSMCMRGEDEPEGGAEDEGEQVEREGKQLKDEDAAKALASSLKDLHLQQEGHPSEEDLKRWGRHGSTASVADQVLRAAGDGHVSFVFSCAVPGRDIGPEPPLQPVRRGRGGGGFPQRRSAPAAREKEGGAERRLGSSVSGPAMGGGRKLAGSLLSRGLALGSVRPALLGARGPRAAPTLPSLKRRISGTSGVLVERGQVSIGGAAVGGPTPRAEEEDVVLCSSPSASESSGGDFVDD